MGTGVDGVGFRARLERAVLLIALFGLAGAARLSRLQSRVRVPASGVADRDALPAETHNRYMYDRVQPWVQPGPVGGSPLDATAPGLVARARGRGCLRIPPAPRHGAHRLGLVSPYDRDHGVSRRPPAASTHQSLRGRCRSFALRAPQRHKRPQQTQARLALCLPLRGFQGMPN